MHCIVSIIAVLTLIVPVVAVAQQQAPPVPQDWFDTYQNTWQLLPDETKTDVTGNDTADFVSKAYLDPNADIQNPAGSFFIVVTIEHPVSGDAFAALLFHADVLVEVVIVNDDGSRERISVAPGAKIALELESRTNQKQSSIDVILILLPPGASSPELHVLASFPIQP